MYRSPRLPIYNYTNSATCPWGVHPAINMFHGSLQYSTDVVVIPGQPGIGVLFSLFAIVFLPRRLNMRNLWKLCSLYCVLLFRLCGPTAHWHRLPGARYLRHLSREWYHNPQCHDPGLLCDSGGKSDTCGLRCTSYNPLPTLLPACHLQLTWVVHTPSPKQSWYRPWTSQTPAIEYALEYFST